MVSPNAQTWRQQAVEEAKENEELRKKNAELIEAIDRLNETAWQPFEATAYTAGVESTGKSVGDIGYGITASGKRVREGRTVACPKNLPFGTTLLIENVGERVCEDRGGDIKEGRLDIYFEDENKALLFGRRVLHVKIVR
ncbi:3D domain-containing protein [Cytobacillus sp. FSL R7-0696]|uniref:3D domain-containing protein n=1 Tax=Cytobacillus sp. FSL R7-0696 TaxID=2921691 RepID=UPI0030FC6E34